MAEIDLLAKYPKPNRPIDERSFKKDESVKNIAKKFDFDYFDGERSHGYGGYTYNPRFWTETVKHIYNHYGLNDKSSILDVGCAKGFMLYDFFLFNKNLNLRGIDISNYAIKNCKEEIKNILDIGNASELPYEDSSFDLIISINTIHNLKIDQLKKSLKEIIRVTKKNAFITVDAWRNDEEKSNMLKWNLTAETYMHVDDWKEVFDEVGYDYDYFWFIP